MSEFFIQEKQLSAITRTVITDEDGHSLYLLVGRWGTKGDALSLYRMDGSLVASIKQVSFTFGNRFEIYENYQKVGTLQKIFNWPGDFYYIKQLKWRAHGDIYNHHYRIHHFTKKIMSMDKASLLRGDFYVLDVIDDQDAPKCICIAAIMDYWLYNRKKQQSENYKLKLANYFE
ncbi:LURP-one-related/scramblase family protein [Enterococcus olivae]